MINSAHTHFDRISPLTRSHPDRGPFRFAPFRNPHTPIWMKNERGATLIETVVAVGLFALTVATMNNFLVHQIRAGSSNYSYSKAYAIAAEEFEDIRRLRYESIASRSSTVQEGALTYTLNTTVAENTPAPNMKQITVEVSWVEPGGARNVKVHSIYTSVRR